MKRTNWFERQFPPIEDNGLLPGIVERLEGTPARLFAKLSKISPEKRTQIIEGKWSIQKEVGHLLDLEPLWLFRANELRDGVGELSKADLTNRKTHETDYDAAELSALLSEFSTQRERLVALIRQLDEADLVKTARHPRLGTPMRVVDLAFFVAEHDDHHLAQITFLADHV